VGGENSASHINTAPAVSQQASKTFMMRLPAAFGTAVPHVIPSLLPDLQKPKKMADL